MKLLVLISSLSATTWAYSNLTSSCFACLSNATSYFKFCVPYENSPQGWCCDTANTSDICSTSSQYLCTDLTPSKNLQTYLCPNQQTKCFASSLSESFTDVDATKVLYVNDQSSQVAGTSLNFGY
jgi:hypothetical protein